MTNIVGITNTVSGLPIDGTYVVYGVAGNSFNIGVIDPNNPSNILPVATSGTYTKQRTSFIAKAFIPTWEKEVIDLGGKADLAVPYQTPITPWFLSDFDSNGQVTRLFRLWSISDGEAADTEIKIEISNINPSGNLNYGSFDLYIRDWADQEDTGRSVYESFPNCTLNPKSNNYILRRIGDGDNFPLQSKFVFIEMNEDDTIPNSALPYGVEGYANVDGLKTPDVRWTTQYDLTKPLTKQMLGLSNNSYNTFGKVAPDTLAFKNLASDLTEGVGFHLNPQYLTSNQGAEGAGGNLDAVLYANLLNKNLHLVDHRAYNTSSTNSTKLTGTNLVSRMKYVVDMFGGFDGWNVYSVRTWEDTTSLDYQALQQGIEIFSDNESIYTDFSVLVTPDINFEEHPAASADILEMVQKRGDALYIFDFNYGYNQKVNPTIDATSAKESLLNSNMLTSYSATYYPDTQLSDVVNNVNPWLAPSVVALATIASVATNEYVWQPPGGSLRTVTTNLVRTRKRMKIGDREILKSANINPITEFPGSGFEITETRTTQPVLSALSFIHNRLLLGYAKKALNQILRPLLQQLKTESLRDAFVNAVTPVFARIKRLNGLEQFEVVATGLDEDLTTLHGQIIITPLYPVERIIVDFVLQNGSLQFNQ